MLLYLIGRKVAIGLRNKSGMEITPFLVSNGVFMVSLTGLDLDWNLELCYIGVCQASHLKAISQPKVRSRVYTASLGR
jgi:hypothetical protein